MHVRRGRQIFDDAGDGIVLPAIHGHRFPDRVFVAEVLGGHRLGKDDGEGLDERGFGIAVEPTGAFYVLANAKTFSSNSLEFAFEILKEAKVGVTPGIDFGKNAEVYLRFSYANSLENITEGLNRVEEFLRNR